MADEKGLKLLFWLGTMVMLFLTFIVLLIAILYQRRVFAVRQDQARKLMAAALAAEQKERKRLAAGLHDGICGDISAIRNFVTILNPVTDIDKEVVQEISSALDSTLASVREFSYNLMPPLLLSSGLMAALRDYFKRLRLVHHVDINGAYPDDAILLSDIEAYELYFMVQELVNNALKHGAASKISLTIVPIDRGLHMFFGDDGVVFDFYQNLKMDKGLGLRNVSSRLDSIGAVLIQETSPTGNRLRITLNRNNKA